LAVNHEIQGDSQAMVTKPFEDAQLLGVGGGAGDFAGDFRARALKAELEVIEAGGYESRESRFVKRKPGSDEVYVQASGARGGDEIQNVRAREGFASGEICLEDAELSGSVKNFGPLVGGKLVGAGVQFEGIRTVDAMQRTPMGKFGDEGQGMREAGVHLLIAAIGERIE
jgi:hypothetical protein